jgi:hypothetical protein
MWVVAPRASVGDNRSFLGHCHFLVRTMSVTEPAPSSVDQSADTYGWDTVFAIHIDDVNNSIKKAMKANPSDYPVMWSATDDADGISVVGRFGAWAVVPGGSGGILRMLIPMTANVTFGGTTTAVSGSAHVDLRLTYLHDADLAAKGKVRKHLKVNVDALNGDPSGRAAVVVKIDFAGKEPGFVLAAGIQSLLQSWLDENLDEFDHVFTSVDLNRMADKDQFQWMQPTDVAYAYADLPDSAGGGVLAVLCMTEGRSSGGLILQVSPFAIPNGQRAGFLISRERLIEKLLLPCMPHVFMGSRSADFAISATGDSIQLSSTNPSFKVQDKDGNSYTAQLTSFQATVVGSELRVESHTETEVSPGVKALCHSQSFLAVTLVNNPDGAQSLKYADARPAINEHSTWTDPGFTIAKDVLIVLSIVAAAIATVLTAGAATVALVLAVGLGLGVAGIDIALASEEYEKDGAGPEIGSMIFDSQAAINWPDSQDFKLGSANLNVSLQLGGDPIFAE